MQIEETSFFRLLRLGLGTETYTSFPTLTAVQWRTVCSLAGRQSMYGILMSGIETLPEDKRPPREILLRLISICCEIEQKNRLLNRKAKQLSDHYSSLSFTPILLKGQGIATLYPAPYRRMSGDIDMWLPQSRSRVLSLMKKERPDAEHTIHHVHFKDTDGTDIEIHTLPAYMLNPLTHFRLLRYISRWKHQSRQVTLPDTAGTISVPSDEMNLIFLLLHKYRHLLFGGIGLRQMTDYMMLLRCGFTDEERRRVVSIVRHLRLTTFCGAVMYVLSEYLGLENRYLLIEPNVEAGRHLLQEIMTGGNFGHYDTRDKNPYTPGSIRSFIHNNRKSFRRFASDYSSEIRWLPINKFFNKMMRILKR